MKEGFRNVFDRIATAAEESGRRAEDITVIAATKTRTPEELNECKMPGLIFGENRVQEFLEKFPSVPGVTWHFIGRLQTNKVKYIIDKVELIHSVDRSELAREIDKRAASIGKVQDVLLEINLGDEESKGGASRGEFMRLAEQVCGMKNIAVKGVMTVMPLIPITFDGYAFMTELFVECKKDFPGAEWKYISVGMSDDFEKAIRAGSNMVRIGRAFFGERKYK